MGGGEPGLGGLSSEDGLEEMGEGGPGGLRICRCGKVDGGGGGAVVWSRPGRVKLGPPSHFFFRFLGLGEPATIELSPPPTSCPPLGGVGREGWGRGKE